MNVHMNVQVFSFTLLRKKLAAARDTPTPNRGKLNSPHCGGEEPLQQQSRLLILPNSNRHLRSTCNENDTQLITNKIETMALVQFLLRLRWLVMHACNKMHEPIVFGDGRSEGVFMVRILLALSTAITTPAEVAISAAFQ